MYDLLSCRDTYSLQRRLRIRTVQFEAARNINEIYDTVDPEVILSILVHEVNPISGRLWLLSMSMHFVSLGATGEVRICRFVSYILHF